MPSDFAHAMTLALLPEAMLVGIALLSVLIAVLRPGLRPDIHRWIACIGLVGSLAACGLVLLGLRNVRSGVAITVWNGGFVVDSFALFIAILACVTALCTCLISDSAVRNIPSRSSAFYALILISTAAAEAIAAEREMTTLFIALALLLVCLVALGALVKTNPRGAVSSFEHLIEGGVGLALVLYGLALLYGTTRNTNLDAVAPVAGAAAGAVALGVALVVLGLCATLGVFPLRRWVGRVATSVPAGAAGFIIAISLVAGGAALARVTVSGLGPAVGVWRWLVPIVAAVALGHASLSSLRETTVSRLIGQLVSTQAAMLLLGLLAFTTGSRGLPAYGMTAFLGGLGVTAIATLAAFGVLAMLQVAGIGDAIDDVRGLAHRSAPAALLMTVAVGTLAGVPPLAGFLTRLLLVSSAADTHYGWLAIIAVGATLLTMVAALRFVATLYADAGDEVPFTLGATPLVSRIVAGAACFAGVGLVVLIQPLLAVATAGAGTLR
ncbi:MAG TPA: proton-conducting transporter membrane subunit [Candidatus Saccharimonadales bacterium]|nr:proton-conducting transporter membrane subunit [Candidatus Saccharimonadales bacterium]